jgi:hypothetical protein
LEKDAKKNAKAQGITAVREAGDSLTNEAANFAK